MLAKSDNRRGTRLIFTLLVLAAVSVSSGGLVDPAAARGLRQDISLMKPADVAYREAMEFSRALTEKGIKVKSVHRSTLEGFFQGLPKAAFYRTDKGIVEVIFFPDAASAARIQVNEQRRQTRYLYSFTGQPRPNPPGDTIDSSRQIHFITHGKWFIVPDGKEMYDALKAVFKS